MLYKKLLYINLSVTEIALKTTASRIGPLPNNRDLAAHSQLRPSAASNTKPTIRDVIRNHGCEVAYPSESSWNCFVIGKRL